MTKNDLINNTSLINTRFNTTLSAYVIGIHSCKSVIVTFNWQQQYVTMTKHDNNKERIV